MTGSDGAPGRRLTKPASPRASLPVKPEFLWNESGSTQVRFGKSEHEELVGIRNQVSMGVRNRLKTTICIRAERDQPGPQFRPRARALSPPHHLSCATLASAMVMKTLLRVSVLPSARWISMIEMSWLVGSIQPCVPKAPPCP